MNHNRNHGRFKNMYKGVQAGGEDFGHIQDLANEGSNI